MTLIFGIGYFALCGFVAAESVLLWRMMSGAQALLRLYEPIETGPDDPVNRILGARVPRFRAQVEDWPEPLTDESLGGKSHMLLFLDSSAPDEIEHGRFHSVVYTLLQRIDGTVYVVTDGATEARRLCETHRTSEFYGDRVRCVVDRKREMRKRFNISSTPIAIQIDEQRRVAKIGRAVAPETTAAPADKMARNDAHGSR